MGDANNDEVVAAEAPGDGPGGESAAVEEVSATPAEDGPAATDEVQPAGKGKGPLWRRTLAWVFLVIGLVLVPLAVTGDWVRANIFSTDGFVAMVGPLGSDPAIQDQVAVSLTNQLFTRLDVDSRIANALPDRLGILAGPIADRLEARTLQGAKALTHSDQFSSLWTGAMTRVHGSLVRFLNGTGKVYLGEEGTITIDMSGLSSRLVDRLANSGVQISADERPILATGQIPVAQLPALEKVRGLLQFVNRLFILLPILAVVFLAGSVAVAVRRLRAAMRVGIGLMIAMAIFLILIAVGRTIFMDATAGAAVSTAAAEAIWGSLTIALRASCWGLFVVGLLLLVGPYIVRAFRGKAMERAVGGAADRGWDPGPVGRFIARHRVWLALGVLVVGFLALALADGPPVWAIVLVAIIVVVVDALLFFLARLSELAAKERAEVIDGTA